MHGTAFNLIITLLPDTRAMLSVLRNTEAGRRKREKRKRKGEGMSAERKFSEIFFKETNQPENHR